MKSVSILLALVLSAALSACSKPEVEGSLVQEKGTGTGPFDLVLSSESTTIPNNVSSGIWEPDGVGGISFYNLGLPTTQYLVFDSYSMTTTGCESAVTVRPLWFPDEGALVVKEPVLGATIMNNPNVRGRLIMGLEGLKGCTYLKMSVVVRRLNIGAQNSWMESNLQGVWDNIAADGLHTTLDIANTWIGWKEQKNSNTTCNFSIDPNNALETGGGWLVKKYDGKLICHYRFDSPDLRSMVLNCYGQNEYGCTVPKNVRFQRR